MFGFQRVMDLIWAAGDIQARGFLIGGTAGRTTLNGEGLQHQDGHSHIMASMIPNCVSYDPAYSFELAVIIQNGLQRMYAEKENIFYYITVMNEAYGHPEIPKGVEQDIIKGIYLLKESTSKAKLKVQLIGSGTILREVEAAAELLKADWKVHSDVWSMTSANELRRDATHCSRYNLMHPGEKTLTPFITQQLEGRQGPVIAATDYMKVYADQLREFIPQRFTSLGTDGYGRSDTRKKLRSHFEVDRYFIVCAALKALADDGEFPMADVKKAMKKYAINPDKADPVSL
jgi:pyruvate dehydrogenase E1 component